MASEVALATDDHRQLALLDEDTPKLKVAKANALVEAQYDLTGKAHKLVLIAMAQIKKDQTQLFEQIFPVQDLVELLGGKRTSAYTEMNRIAKDLMKKQVEVKNQTTGEWELYQWVVKAWCKKGHFGIRFSEDLKPFLLGLVGKYTMYELGAIIKMDSGYSIRLFELLKQYEAFGSRTFSLNPSVTKDQANWESFPKLMGYDPAKGSYVRFHNVKQRVIEPAIKQIEELTEFTQVTYKIIRFNRSPIAVKFSWKTSGKLEELSDHPLYPELLSIGLSKDTARRVFSDYDEKRIGRNLAHVKELHRKGKVKNPPAYLMDALKEDYVEPEFDFGSGAPSAKDTSKNAPDTVSSKHPLRSHCSSEQEFKMILEAETERGEAFTSYNEFHQYKLRKQFS